MANTPNYNLYKPNRADTTVEVDTSLTTNFETIDTELKARKDELDTHKNDVLAHDSDKISHADGSVRSTLENHEERIIANEAAKDDHETRITTAEGTVLDHETRLTDVEVKATDIDTRVTDIEVLGIDKLAPNLEGRITTLESDVEGFLAPATFDAMDQQGYTFDEYRIGYVADKLAPIETQLAQKAKLSSSLSDFLNSAGIKIANFNSLDISNLTNNQLKSNTHMIGGGAKLLSIGTPQNNVANLMLTNLENVIIEGFVFDGNKANVAGDINAHVAQILITNCKNVIIRGNYFKNSNGAAVILSGTNEDIKIVDNTFIAMDSYINGDHQTSGKNIYISNNTFDGTGNTNSEPIILDNATGVHVHNNNFYNKVTGGVVLNKCFNATVSNNYFDNIKYAVIVYSSDNVKVNDNVAINSAEAFVVALGSTVAINNNTLDKNKRDLYIVDGILGITSDASKSTTIRYESNITKDYPLYVVGNRAIPIDIRKACKVYVERNIVLGDLSAPISYIQLTSSETISIVGIRNELSTARDFVNTDLMTGTLNARIVDNKNVVYTGLTNKSITCYSYSTTAVTSS